MVGSLASARILAGGMRTWLPVAIFMFIFLLAHTGGTESGGDAVGGRKYFLSVAAIFRDEDLYLPEWIEFHRCAGVEHFFLYNHHSSSDKHEEILQPYIDAGVVTLEQAVCDVHCQVPTYTLCMESYGHLTKWLAFIDLDEFLMPSPSDAAGSNDRSLPETLQLFDQHAAVLVHWLSFGSSMHETTPEGLVIENYVFRAREPNEVIKSVVQPDRVLETGGHNHRYKPGFEAVNDAFVPVLFNFATGEAPSTHHPPSVQRLRIHHYRTKSLQHALSRFDRDRTFRLNEFESPDIYPSTPEEERQWLEKWDVNEEEDQSAQRFAACVLQGLRHAVKAGPSELGVTVSAGARVEADSDGLASGTREL